MILQNLTYNEIKCRARDAYRQKRLTAQSEIPENRRCVYRTRENRYCVIGAALNDEVFAALKDDPTPLDAPGNMLGTLIGIPPLEYRKIIKLQRAYDLWAGSAQGNYSYAKEHERNFLRLIYS